MPPPTPLASRGGGGLDRSQHANHTPPSHPPPPQPYDIDAIKKILDGMVALANPESKGTMRGMGQDILAAFRKVHNAAQHQTGTISLANLRKVVAEEVKSAVTGAQDKRSWAAVASPGPGPSQTQATAPTKIVPARLNKEILVRGRGIPADMTKRTPQEIVQAVNLASAKKGAIAARKLPSGDTIVFFQTTATKDWHSANAGWIKEAFGQQAEENKRTFAVLLKGLWKQDLQGKTEEEFGKEIGLRTVDKVKFRIPKHQEATRATALVTLTSQEEARKVCDEGVVWKSQLLDCEPYWAALSPVQCFRCWKWGHTQHHCRSTPLCSRCGTKAHGEGGRDGEAQCPTHNKEIPLRCPVCGGRHPAWAKECPEKAKVLAKAKEAYQFRPRTYEVALTTAPKEGAPTATTPFTFTVEDESDNGYQVVGRKRMRGRPTNASAAQFQALRDPQQTRINFDPAGERPANLPASNGTEVSGARSSAQLLPLPDSATAAVPTTTAAPRLDGEDTVMDTIIVGEDEI